MAEKEQDFNPSIGVIGGIEQDAVNLRHKGFLVPAVCGLEQLQQVYQQAVAAVVNGVGDRDRVTVRMLIGEEFDLDQLESFSWNHGGLVTGLEGFIPVDTNGFGVQAIVYFGGNGAERMPSAEVIRQEQQVLAQARQEACNFPPQSLPEGYTVQVLPPNSLMDEEGNMLSDEDIESLVTMYGRAYKDYPTAFNAETVKSNAFSSVTGLVRNPQGVIVSVTMGEITPPVAGVRLCEISESATDPFIKVVPNQTEGDGRIYDPDLKNANFWAKEAVVEYLVKQGVEVIYTESRANWKAVLRSNFWLGMEAVGWLPRHCRISSALESIIDAEDDGFGDLVVMALPVEKRQEYLRR